MSFAVRTCKSVPLFVSCSNVTGIDSGASGSGTVHSDTAPTPVIVNGSGSYSYLYARVSGDSPTVGLATAENPGWTATVSDGDPNVSTWRLTVTDLNTGNLATTTFTVTLNWTNIS